MICDCGREMSEYRPDKFKCTCGRKYEQLGLFERMKPMGKTSQRKGADGEREFARLTGGVRIPLSGGMADSGEEFANDVKLPNGMKAEVKRFKTGEKTLYTWIMDEREKPDVVAFRADRMPWIVAMKLDHFMVLMAAQIKLVQLIELAKGVTEHLDDTGLPIPGFYDEFAQAAKALQEGLVATPEFFADYMTGKGWVNEDEKESC